MFDVALRKRIIDLYKNDSDINIKDKASKKSKDNCNFNTFF